MQSNTILFGWNRPIPGREHTSATHFNEFVDYLASLVKSGIIETFDTVFLEPHGGDLNGFFLLKGNPTNLNDLTGSEDWARHMTRAGMHLEGHGFVRGFTGDAIMDRMQLWTGTIPE